MIGKLTGKIDSTHDDHIILDVNGVGYLVNCSGKTLSAIGSAGDAASLLIETMVREDAITLYGFANANEKRWFGILLTVQGIGARVALAILSVLSPAQIEQTIMAEDKASFTRVPGVGPKLAGRMLTELKDKVGKITSLEPANTATSTTPAQDGVFGDAVSALTHLGISRMDAFTVVTGAIRKKPEGELQDIITLSLKELNK